MTAREELLQIMGKVLEWGEKAALNEFTPDLWLRYGIEQGWVPEDLEELRAKADRYDWLITHDSEAVWQAERELQIIKTPERYLEHGLEMGWVELTGTLYSVDDFDPIDDPPQRIGERSPVYRFTASAEKERGIDGH